MWNSGEDSNVPSRKCSSTASTPGIWIRPPNSAPTASTDIAIAIGRRRSAIWCSGPGKPTSVSSTSPVAGLRGSA